MVRASGSFSVVVPVHNEARLVESALPEMLHDLEALGEFELILCDNGSSDETAALVRERQSRDPRLRLEALPEADYGGALRHGIAACRHDRILIFNIDFWSIAFARESLARLDDAEVVVGSKVMAGASDRRPWVRRWMTLSFNRLLAILFGFKGTDTHGVKALRRDALEAVLARCVTSRSIFDTELILRAERSGLNIVEIPVDVRERRRASYWRVASRVPEVGWNLVKLYFALSRHAA